MFGQCFPGTNEDLLTLNTKAAEKKKKLMILSGKAGVVVTPPRSLALTKHSENRTVACSQQGAGVL